MVPWDILLFFELHFPSSGCLYIWINSMQLFLFSITFCKMFLLLGYGLHMLVFMVHLRELASGLESTVIASGATGTTDVYRRAFPRWRCFAASSDEIQAFPAKLSILKHSNHLKNSLYQILTCKLLVLWFNLF